jgi:hypothetical protein
MVSISSLAWATAESRIARTRFGEMPFCTTLRSWVCWGGSSNWRVVRRKSGNGTKKGTASSPVRNGSRTKRGSLNIARAAAWLWMIQTSPP